jgi:hypothetical protein
MSDITSSSIPKAAATHRQQHQLQPPPLPLPLPPLAFGNSHTSLELLRSHAKQLFDAEQQMVLSLLPDAYKGRWGKAYKDDEDRIVVVKSPYDIPMGPERTLWMAKFATVRGETTAWIGGRNSRGADSEGGRFLLPSFLPSFLCRTLTLTLTMHSFLPRSPSLSIFDGKTAPEEQPP